VAQQRQDQHLYFLGSLLLLPRGLTIAAPGRKEKKKERRERGGWVVPNHKAYVSLANLQSHDWLPAREALEVSDFSILKSMQVQDRLEPFDGI